MLAAQVVADGPTITSGASVARSFIVSAQKAFSGMARGCAF
ncbi:hypothetical protein [Azospirillum brasilense]|nr:hypothetical protein [Azospirillum brasilense]